MMRLFENEPKHKGIFTLFLLLIAPLLMGTSWPAVPPEELADVIVILVPDHDHALNIPMKVERPIKGQIVRYEKGPLKKGQSPEPVIVLNANTIIAPLNQGVPKKLYLKKFPDRDAYYLIGVDPVQSGGRK